MKQMIWSSYDLLDETAKEYYQNSQREILDDDCYQHSFVKIDSPTEIGSRNLKKCN